MSELRLRWSGFICSAWKTFTKYCERIQKFKVTGDLSYIYKSKLDKACFAHYAAYANSKDLVKRTVSCKVLKNSTYEIALNPKYHGYQKGLVSMLYKFFHKKIISGGRVTVNEVLAEELNKSVIKKKKKIFEV